MKTAKPTKSIITRNTKQKSGVEKLCPSVHPYFSAKLVGFYSLVVTFLYITAVSMNLLALLAFDSS